MIKSKKLYAHRVNFPLFLMLAAVLLALSCDAGSAAGQGGKMTGSDVYIIGVSGDVEPVMAAFLKRAVETIPDKPGSVIILELDTFGGRVDAALNMVDTMTGVTEARTIAFVRKKAISAGALIALSCNDLVMQPNTTIGDCAPISFTQEGAKMLGEKFQSPLRAKFRTLARRNNYPPTLAESMVTARMEVFALEYEDRTVYMNASDYEDLSETEKKKIISRKTVVAEGELLTMDDTEARQLGFSRVTAASIDELLEKLNITAATRQKVQPTWSETLGRFISAISPLLMIIGMASLYAEFKAPGFGFAGILGLFCLGLVFLNQYIVGLADYTEMILIVLGVILIGFEIFVIPGFGIAGISGMVLIGTGMILSFQDFVVPDPDMPWQSDILFANITSVLASFLVAFFVSMAFVRYMLPRLGGVVSGPYLQATLAESRADSLEAATVRIGDVGEAATGLRPSGKVRIGDVNIDVVSEGDLIEKGAKVRIIAIKGNRVIVRRAE